MKKYIFKSQLLFLVLTVSFVSCDNYLDESPDDRLDLDSLDKAAKVVADAYGQGSYSFTDMFTDLAGPTGNPDGDGVVQTTGGNSIDTQERQTYKWEAVDAIFQDSPTYFWDNSYKAIAQTNEVLAVIDGLEGDQDKRNAIKGEALLARAYNHFMLVNMFGLHYNAQANANLGVPYVLEPEIEFLPEYTRNTVEEVYNLAEKDLLEGLSLINDKFFIGTKKYHFTKKAGYAFASRFYLWKRDYANAIKYSDLFFDGNPDIYIKNYDNINGSGYNESADMYGNPEDESNVMVIQRFSNYQRRGDGFRLNSREVNNLFDNLFNANDRRTQEGIWNAGTDARFLARLREFFFRENLTSNSGTPYHIAVVLKGEEVLLNRAEAHLLSGNQTMALADINLLALARYNTEYTSIEDIMDYYLQTDEQAAVLALILDERKKEFWDHGLRWFDIKRHNMPVTHVLPVSEGGETLELLADDQRKAVQIPKDAISFGLTPNPR